MAICQRTFDDLYVRLDSKERETDFYRLSVQRDKDGRMCNRLE